MITKGTTTIVRFYVTTTDGFPATGKASNITAAISVDGATATAITDTISETDQTNLPGWYEFEHTFNTAGNVFITFSCANCMIMPWEDDVVEISGGGGGSGPSAAEIATAVWSYEDEDNIYHPYRTILGIEYGNETYQPYGVGHDTMMAETLWGFDTSTVLDTTTAAYRLTDIQNNAARPGDAMTLTAAYNAAKTAAQAGDAMTLTAAYNAAKTASQFDAATDMVTINATQAATLAAASDLDSVATKVELIKSKTDNLPTNPAATGDAMTLTSAYDAAKTASQFNAATDTVTINATQAATMVTATGFATPSDIPTSDITAIKTKVDALHNTDLTGIATSANVTAAQTAIIAAMPTIPTDYAKASDLTSLSTFNASTDTVTINSTQAATMVTATGFATPTTITTAQAAIIAHGDENWVGGGGGGGATPKQIWEYTDRTLTASPTDISSLATKTDLTTAVSGLSTFNASTDKVSIKATQVEDLIDGVWAYKLYLQNVGYTAGTILAGTMSLSDAILDATDTITTYGDSNWTTAIIPTADITHIKTKVDTLHNTDLTGIATSTDIINAQAAILNAVPAAVWGADLTTYTDTDTAANQIYTALSNCATGTDTAVLSEILKDLNAGVLNWSVTANALTTYNDNNTVRGTYTLTRDTEGNITRILPNS